MIILRNKLFSPGVGGENLDSLRRLYEKNVATNPEFANSSRGQKLMERIKYEQSYVKPTPNVPATIQKPIVKPAPNVPTIIKKPVSNVPAAIQKPIPNIPTSIQKPMVKPTVKPIPKIGTAGKLLGSAAIIGTGILAANALTKKNEQRGNL
jgi:hypothetical protein